MIIAKMNSSANLSVFKPWHMQMLGAALWHRHVARSLLKFSDVPSSFTKHAQMKDVHLAIYHAHPLQLFKSLPEEERLLRAWQGQLKPHLARVPILEKAFVDYVKARLRTGAIFSLPTELLPDAAGNPPPLMDPGAHLQASLVLATRDDEACREQLGVQHRNHTFFKVVRADIANRFCHGKVDENKRTSMALSKLMLSGRQGLAGVFKHSGGLEAPPSVERPKLCVRSKHKSGDC